MGAAFVATIALTRFVAQKVISAFNPSFGLCGGMAFAALDYYNRAWVVPRGYPVGWSVGLTASPDFPNPDPSTPQGAELRDYIFKRQSDSLAIDGYRFVLAKILYHLIPGGSGILLTQAESEWGSLKRHLDEGNPWPIGCVGGNLSPWADHQVLA